MFDPPPGPPPTQESVLPYADQHRPLARAMADQALDWFVRQPVGPAARDELATLILGWIKDRTNEELDRLLELWNLD